MKAKVIETGEIIDVKRLCCVTYSRLDCNGKIIGEYDEDELDFNFDENPLDDKFIYKFNGEYKLAKYPPKEEGYYMTIRCGMSGIYTCVNVWKDNKWQIEAADASDTIAYSKELISKKIVDEWVKKKLEKYHNELTKN
jgi:hypothetical protein